MAGGEGHAHQTSSAAILPPIWNVDRGLAAVETAAYMVCDDVIGISRLGLCHKVVQVPFS